MSRQSSARCTRRQLLAGCAGIASLGATTMHGALASCRSGEQPWFPDAALLADLPRLMRALAVPGLAIAVVEDGEVAWSRTFGAKRAGADDPVVADTLFEAASLSKPVFAYLVLQLVDEGKLELDRPLVAYRRPDYLSDSPLLERITARDVLRHSTGLPNWRAHPASEKLEPAVMPGTRIDYSGEAIVWLQLVVERVTGTSLDGLMRERLFDPAGMRDSTYTWNADVAARSVHGHAGPDGEPAKPEQWFREAWGAAQQVADRHDRPLASWTYDDAAQFLPEAQAIAPPGLVNWPGDIVANAAASLRTTAPDYARFLTLCMRRARREPWELQASTRAAMLTPQLPLPARWSQKTLGWNLETTGIGPLFFHSGSNGGVFKTFALGDAARRRGIVVFTNSGGGHLLYRRIVRDAVGLDLLAFDV